MLATPTVLKLVDSYENLHWNRRQMSPNQSSEYKDYEPKKNCSLNYIKPQTDEEPSKETAWFESLASRRHFEKFLRDTVEVLINHGLFEAVDRKTKVVEWINPEEMKQKIDFKLNALPENEGKLMDLIKNIIKYSVKTGHPYFANQLFSSVDPYGLVGQWLTDVLNASVYTYEVSPVFTMMEEEVLREMRKIVGFPNGEGDGLFCPGGSIANGYAISCARYKFFPDVKTRGLHYLPRLILFTSQDAHYSIKKLSSFMGLGTDNVFLIKTDSVGKMSMEHLESEIQRALKEGGVPFMVSATAGTTVLGAFDPLNDIANVCEKHGMWFHVDAAWGGGVLMSDKYKQRIKGIERADSVIWNPHKLLSAPQQCSTMLTRHKNLLGEVHSSNATYLFQKDKFYDTQYDTGDKHIQCGRRPDVLKFWFMWKAKGTLGFQKHIEKVFDNAEYFTNLIRKRDDFKLVLENPECTNISFWYIPPSLRDKSENDSDYNEQLHKIAPKIKERMMKSGSMMVTYQPLGVHPNFFRFVMQNSGLEHYDMQYFVDEIVRLGQDL